MQELEMIIAEEGFYSSQRKKSIFILINCNSGMLSLALRHIHLGWGEGPLRKDSSSVC